MKRHRRLIAALVVLAVAIAVGIAYGYLAGIAVALGAITILLFIIGIGIESDPDLAGVDPEKYSRRRMGLEDDDSRGVR